MFIDDPDVPRLQKTLKALQRDVKDGLTTPAAANATLGMMADMLVRLRDKAVRLMGSARGRVNAKG